MIISETKQFVFLHNPKCGGTTVRSALLPFDTTGNFFWMFADTNNMKIDKAHMPMHIMRRVYPDYFELLKTSFVFMLVRNPYRRAISSFNETRGDLLKAIQQARAAKQDETEKQAHQTYKDALNGFIAQLKGNDLNGWSFKHRHWVRQRDMAYMGTKRIADLVMKIEDWPHCLDVLALFDAALKTALIDASEKNVREMPFEPMESLTHESIRQLNKVYHDDFMLFGYPMM